MNTIQLFLETAKITLKNWRYVVTWGVLYAIFSNGFGYAIDAVPFDYFDLYIEYGTTVATFAAAVFIGVAVAGLLLFLSPLEVIWHRTVLFDETDEVGMQNLGRTSWVYFTRYLVISFATLLPIAPTFLLVTVVQEQFSDPDQIFDPASYSMVTQLLFEWWNSQFILFLFVLFHALLSLPLVAIAFGHTTAFKAAFLWHMRHFPRTAVVVFLWDTLFFVLHEAIDQLFDQQNQTEIEFPHILFETVHVGLGGILSLAIVSLVYREFLAQSFENTKAASRAASVFE